MVMMDLASGKHQLSGKEKQSITTHFQIRSKLSIDITDTPGSGDQFILKDKNGNYFEKPVGNYFPVNRTTHSFDKWNCVATVYPDRFSASHPPERLISPSLNVPRISRFSATNRHAVRIKTISWISMHQV